MAQERIRIISDWGEVTAELIDNAATKLLIQMLPVTIPMHDHLRQEKTGNLPSALPEAERQVDFSKGTLGLCSSDHFVNLLSRWPRSSARNHHTRQHYRRCFDL